MSTYRVTLDLTEGQFLRFAAGIGAGTPFHVQAKPSAEESAPAAKAPPPKAKQSRPGRESKVGKAILARLPASIPELKAALADAGLSPASLSTGIAMLTRAGKLVRNGDGQYALAA